VSPRTARQNATLDSFRVVKDRESAILRAQAYRRAALFVLLAVAIAAGAAIVCTVTLAAAGEQLAKQQGRAR
jgi:hypothetical protein